MMWIFTVKREALYFNPLSLSKVLVRWYIRKSSRQRCCKNNLVAVLIDKVNIFRQFNHKIAQLFIWPHAGTVVQVCVSELQRLLT